MHFKRSRRELNATAYHEAGHAVVACLMGISVHSASILVDETTLGRVTHRVFPPPQHADYREPDMQARVARRYWARFVSAALAGPVAESIYTKCWKFDEFDRANPDEWAETTDEGKAWDIASSIDPDAQALRWLNRIRFSTLELLQQQDMWQAVHAVAEALLRKERLPGWQVRRLVHAVLPQVETSAPLAASTGKLAAPWHRLSLNRML